ncbi:MULTISPECIES: hypothetical protein [Streptomyces]|uniref:hypothetical protein n=1 Tax=Streptomyces TaxID=1883 RepID=UPI00368ED797
MAHRAMPAAARSSLPDRRVIAVGTIRRTVGRTVSTVRTADGVTGTITRRCPVCRCPFEECTCTGGAQ